MNANIYVKELHVIHEFKTLYWHCFEKHHSSVICDLFLVTQRPKLKSPSPYLASQVTVAGKYGTFIFPLPLPSLDIIFICFEEYLGFSNNYFILQKHLP